MAQRKRKTAEETDQKANTKSKNSEAKKDSKLPRHSITYLSLLYRIAAVAICIALVNWYYNKQASSQLSLAKQSEDIFRRRFNVTCSADFKTDLKKFKECAPVQCARVVMDNVITKSESEHLLRLATSGISLGGSNGGASILDLHTGALSKGDSFINIYNLLKTQDLGSLFQKEDFSMYSTVARKIKFTIASEFGVPINKLHLTNPTFFSRMTNKPAVTLHDEYWHVHVDKETYETFDYTSLLYLSDYGVEFEGGRFIFTDKTANMTVEPKRGRLSFFTSGSENPHFVEPITEGTRYAITVSFTCDKSKAIDYPKGVTER